MLFLNSRISGLAALGLAVSGTGVSGQTLKLSEFMTKANSQKIELPAGEARRFDAAFKTDFLADLANRRMFVRTSEKLVVYKMGIGRPAASIPFGRTKVTVMRNKPTWTPTPEARIRNPFLPKNIRATADNPLGSRAMNTTWLYYLLHGTNDHEKIGRAATWGCMSLAEKDVAEVFGHTNKGDTIIVHKDVDFVVAGLGSVGLPKVRLVRPKPKPDLTLETANTLVEAQEIFTAALDGASRK